MEEGFTKESDENLALEEKEDVVAELNDYEGCPTYPTLAMLDLQEELNKLANETDKSKHEAFSVKNVLDTVLSLQDAITVVGLFKIHATDVRSTVDFKKKMLEVEGLQTIVKGDVKDIVYFYTRLIDLYHKQKFAFYVRTPTTIAELVDLKELEPRPITIKECGGCKKKPLGKAVLYECKKCKRAAYCNAACRKRDKVFHGRFCAYFVSQSKQANK